MALRYPNSSPGASRHVRLRCYLGRTNQGGYGAGIGCDERDPDATVPGRSPYRRVRAQLRGHRLARIGAPRGTPAKIIDQLNGAINAGLADPKFKSRFNDLGAETFAGSPADFSNFVVDYTEKWAKIIRAAGVKAE
jgi:hypothetical protein